eukprot:CAMPEP_0172166840 /NCGR_PEP_ID=MMETSP1050-20130122/9226_1 /TAXON_ID=233186 /ORGANISM="Cryptomonas curvata, Strain CCAP979/52" /LENGTH=491 /DNA_ID=CAMNT_0012837537 /DNA_START=466 /DNA_END=1938 /DNA_ORIENTATION=-
MLMWPLLFAASSAACVWFRRRSRARHRRHLEERYLEHAVNISVEQQHLDPLQAALTNPQRTPTVISYRVPLAAPLEGKEDIEDEGIADLQEVSVEEEKALARQGVDAYFKTKLLALNRALRKLHRADSKPVRLEVDRNDVFRDSFRAFSRLTGEQLRGPLHVKFRKEDGRDDGGLTRHWFLLISREIVNPEYAMFSPVGNGNTSYQVHAASKHQAHHLDYFRFIGRVLGKAIFDGFLMEAHLASTIYKYLLGLEIARCDMASVDAVYFKNLQWILENDVEAVDLDMYFVVDSEEFGSVTQMELKEGGASLRLTNDNKEEFVDLACRRRLVDSIKPQLDGLKEGFYEVMDPTVLRSFSEAELELVLCGLPVIDIDDWRNHCDYRAGYTADNEVIVWFWELITDWDQEMRARLLQFVTGTSKVPMGGFANLYGATGPKRFQIIRVYNTDRLPQANTCFNELLLPPYYSKERLADCLTISIYDGGDVFALRDPP